MDFNTVIDEQNKIQNFETMNHADRRSAINELRSQKLKSLREGGDKKKIKKTTRDFRRTKPFIHLTRGERSALYRDCLDLIGNHKGLTMFVEAIDKRHESVANKTIDPTNQAFEQIITRFDSFLERDRRWRQLSRMRRTGASTGLIVMDQDQATEKNIQDQFDNIRSAGHHWGHLRHVVDTPFFVSSARCSGIQIVDICAYAVRRYLDKGALPGSHEETNFLKIYSLLDRGDGKLHGFRHFVRRGSCVCLGCSERGESSPGPADTAQTTGNN